MVRSKARLTELLYCWCTLWRYVTLHSLRRCVGGFVLVIMASWANVVRGRPPPRNQSLLKPSQATQKTIQKLTLKEQQVHKINEMDRRTFVLRRVPHNTTTSSILDDLENQIQRPLEEVIESVVRDACDCRRFYIHFKNWNCG